MNICFFDYNFSVVGGIERVLVGLANNLCEVYNVFILSAIKTEEKIPFKLNEKVTVTFLDGKADDRLRQQLFNLRKPIKDFFKENQIDVCLMMGVYPIPICVTQMLFSRTRFIFCDHGALINQMTDKKTTFFRRIASSLCEKTVTLTKRSMDDYMRIFHTPQRKIEYVYNSVPDDIETVPYNCNSKKILSVGRISSEKGPDMMLEVAKLVLDKHEDWQWHIFGDGDQFEAIKRQAELQNLGDKLVFKGAVSSAAELYRDYSIYVLTSYREGLPVVLLEAKKAGLPIVSFDCPTGPAEIVRDSENGFLVPCYDMSLMADKISALIENPELRAAFSEKTDVDLELFDKEKITADWIKIINSVG